jgi:carboxyl-terminal processing protease
MSIAPRVSLRLRAASIAVFWSMLPGLVGAQAFAELPVAAEDVVTRGDFIRAAVQVLGVSVTQSTDATDLPYQRVAQGLVPYVRAAHDKGALTMFGRDLLLARPITRGFALRIVASLTNAVGDPTTDFEDVEDGTPDARAVSVAIDKGWMHPIRDGYFGFRRILKGDEATTLLAKVSGRTPGTQVKTTKPKDDVTTQPIPTISVNFRGVSKDGMDIPKARILETIWQVINDEFLYTDRILPDEAAYKAAEAIVQSLKDPYTSFLRPVNINSLETQINGQVTGIGAQVEMRNNILTIVTPLRSSPAEKAGLLPNDEILKADGVSLSGLDFIQAVEKVRGEKGTKVTLTIRRNSREFDVTVVRDTIKVPEVEITWQGEVAIIAVLQFGKVTETELRPALVKVMEQNPKGIILDLRNNPGGLLHAASIMISNFVPKGSGVAQILARDGERTDVTEESPTIDADVPLVVLVNQGSASASEIVAGSLQDLARAKIVGTKTFGKGTVQQVLRFNDDSGLKITVAEWKTPKGRKIDGVGVMPDIVVEYSSERDEQMLRALELLR